MRQGLALLRGFLVIFQLLPLRYMRTSYHCRKKRVKDSLVENQRLHLQIFPLSARMGPCNLIFLLSFQKYFQHI